MLVNGNYFNPQLKLMLGQRFFVLDLLSFFHKLVNLLKQITIMLVFIALSQIIQIHTYELLITENHEELK